MKNLTLGLIILLLANKTFAQNKFPTKNFGFTPSYIFIHEIDPITHKGKLNYMAQALPFYEWKHNKKFSFRAGLQVAKSYGDKAGNHWGYGAFFGLRQYYNFEVYNKNCQPVIKDNLICSVAIDFLVANNKWDSNIGNFVFSNAPRYRILSVYPLWLDFKIYKRLYIHYNMQFMFSTFSFSIERNNNLGFTYYIK